MTISDILIILATLFSPLIAVQVQKWIEHSREKREAKLQVFYDLMATRATRVDPKHVEALNKIDLEFSPKVRKDKEVLNRWRIYADHLNIDVEKASDPVVAQWIAKGDDLFADLLEALAAAFDYPFDRVQIKRGIYYPRAHNRAELRRELFEHSLIRVLIGETALKMRVTEFPFSEEDSALNRKLQEGIVSAIADGALKTKAV